MATQKLAKVVITANASTAKKVLEEIDALVQKYTEDIQKMTAAGQANTAECKKAESTLKALSQVQRDNIEDTKRLVRLCKTLQTPSSVTFAVLWVLENLLSLNSLVRMKT